MKTHCPRGDTLFNAGTGNCHGGGHHAELYETFDGQLGRLPGETRGYAGLDYWHQTKRPPPVRHIG